MDTRVLNEQRLEAAAQIKEAESAVLAARALLDQRQSEMRASEAVVKQRQAELDSTAKRHVRSNALSQRGAVSAQQLDDDDRAAAERPRGAGVGESPGLRRPRRHRGRPHQHYSGANPRRSGPGRPSGGSLPILTIAS